MSKVNIINLNVNYGLIKAVRGINFTFESNKITSLIGSNGAGKSTTLKAIAGLLKCTGQIQLDQKILPNYLVRKNSRQVFHYALKVEEFFQI